MSEIYEEIQREYDRKKKWDEQQSKKKDYYLDAAENPNAKRNDSLCDECCCLEYQPAVNIMSTDCAYKYMCVHWFGLDYIK